MATLGTVFKHAVMASMLALWAFGGVAAAQEQTTEELARGHFRLGRAHYDNGNFEAAAGEFEQAYQISGRSALLYNIYLAYRDANDIDKAAEALRGYLEKEETVENRAQLQARLRALEESIKERDERAAAEAAEPQPETEPIQEPEQTFAETPQEAPEKKTNLVPWILIGGGGAMIAASIATGVVASGKQSKLEELCPNKKCAPDDAAEADDLESSGQTMAIVTDVMLFGGIAVAGTGAVLLVLDMMKEDSNAPSASLGCLPGSCHGSVKFKF